MLQYVYVDDLDL